MDIIPGVCHLCGNGYDANVRMLVVLRAWAHEPCAQQQGLDQRGLDAAVPCCHSRESLENLCGSLVEHRPEIPTNQIWRSIPSMRQLSRYLMKPDGRFVVLETTTPPPPPASRTFTAPVNKS